MIFQHTWQLVISGRKHATRRLATQGQYIDKWNGQKAVLSTNKHGQPNLVKRVGGEYGVQAARGQATIVRASTGFGTWEVYAGSRCFVQDGDDFSECERGRVPEVLDPYVYKPCTIVIADIYPQDVREITAKETEQEGFDHPLDFLSVWCDMHDKQIGFDVDTTGSGKWLYVDENGDPDVLTEGQVFDRVAARPAANYNGVAYTWR